MIKGITAEQYKKLKEGSILIPADQDIEPFEMKWERLKDMDVQDSSQIRTDIECPKCWRKIYLDTTVNLTSYPDKYKYWCPCGWIGFSHVKWEGEEQETQRR